MSNPRAAISAIRYPDIAHTHDTDSRSCDLNTERKCEENVFDAPRCATSTKIAAYG